MLETLREASKTPEVGGGVLTALLAAALWPSSFFLAGMAALAIYLAGVLATSIGQVLRQRKRAGDAREEVARKKAREVARQIRPGLGEGVDDLLGKARSGDLGEEGYEKLHFLLEGVFGNREVICVIRLEERAEVIARTEHLPFARAARNLIDRRIRSLTERKRGEEGSLRKPPEEFAGGASPNESGEAQSGGGSGSGSEGGASSDPMEMPKPSGDGAPPPPTGSSGNPSEPNAPEK